MSELTEHLDEFRLLFRAGRLWKNEGWRDVVKHQAVQFRAIGELADMLGLSLEEKEKISKVALVHDWDKRMEINPKDFTHEEKEEIQSLIKKVDPDSVLMDATKKGFMPRAILQEPSFLEYLQFYVDIITMGGEIVSVDTRIDELEKRRPELNEDLVLKKDLKGRPFWDVAREVGYKAQEMIFQRLKKNGVEIDKPSQIPSLIKARLPKR